MMSKNGRHFVIVAVLVAIVSVLTYFVLTAIYQLPVAASAEAGPIDRMFNVHFLLISFFFSLISVFVVYSIAVFRREPGDVEDAAHVHGHTGLEIIWTVVPLIIVISLGVWGAFVLADITSAETNQMVVNVTGRQWSWAFTYPEFEDVGVTSELVLPVNRQVRLEMTSDDVLHSFWVPEFRVKQDLVPGQMNTLLVTPTEIGEYKLRCAEICGFDHANMRAPVTVLSEADFANWVAEQAVSIANLSPVERGELWASDYGCVGCHSADGSEMVGPTWLGLYGTEETLEDGTAVAVDDAYLSESILDPAAKITAGFQNVMPANFADRFAADEADLLATENIEVDILADLIAYIQSLEEE